MKCEVTSNTTHGVLISKDIRFKSYQEICNGEKKKVNLGYWGNWVSFKIENNSQVQLPREVGDNINGLYSNMPYEWELFFKFFSIHNIEPNWLYCNETYGWYDEELGDWTGCVGQV